MFGVRVHVATGSPLLDDDDAAGQEQAEWGDDDDDLLGGGAAPQHYRPRPGVGGTAEESNDLL